MPSRKKTNLSRKTRKALGLRGARSQESEEDHDERLGSALARQAASLLAETASQRESRLRSQRRRTQSLRSLENSEDRDFRRSRDRDRHSLSRASETFTQCEERLTAQRFRTTDARSTENEEERDLRLSADRERHALYLRSETFTQRNVRLVSQRTRTSAARSQRNLIEAQILTGCGAGEAVFIPRIPLIPSNFPFRFKRLQFPVSVCFAMTITKSQGQTLRAAGVDLRTGCFSHGQLYVACSRVTSGTELFVLMPAGNTHNVVYKEIL